MEPTSPELRLRHADVAFWALLGLALGALTVPLWLGPIPPLTDFGGHAQMAHAYARIGDGASIWSELLQRNDAWWLPNILLVRLSALFHPWVDAITMLRVLLTAAIVATALGQVALLKTFGRTRWLVFLALPVIGWNSMVTLGFTNYVAGLAFVPWAVVCAHRIARADRIRGPIIGLALLGVGAFFAHGFVVLVVGISALVVLGFAARHWTRLLGGVALVPAGGLWLYWYSRAAEGGDQQGFALVDKLQALLDESIDVLASNADEYVLFALLVALGVALVTSIRWTELPRLKWREWLADRAVVGWLSTLLLLYLLLPKYSGELAVSGRLIPVIATCLFLLPRAAIERWATRIAVAVGIGATFVLGALLSDAVVRFDGDELEEVRPLFADIPPNVRAQCVNVQSVRAPFKRLPLDHNCSGWLAVERDVFAGGGFADTPHNAVRMKPDTYERRAFDFNWDRAEQLFANDYVLVRGRHASPPTNLAVLVKSIDAPDGQRAWTLYRSLVSHLPIDLEALHGGPGGRPFAIECPEGFVASTLVVRVNETRSTVRDAALECRALDVDSGRVVGRARIAASGIRWGTPFKLTCSDRKPLAGITLRSGKLVDAVGGLCPHAMVVGESVLPTELKGGPGGEPAELRCPAGEVMTGLRGRRGELVDALGVTCRNREDLRKQ